jgi:hypothetical protein
VIVRQWARMIPLVALFATFVAVATSSTLVCAEAKKATGTTGSSVVVVNTLMFLASTLDTGQLQSARPGRRAGPSPPPDRRAIAPATSRGRPPVCPPGRSVGFRASSPDLPPPLPDPPAPRYRSGAPPTARLTPRARERDGARSRDAETCFGLPSFRWPRARPVPLAKPPELGEGRRGYLPSVSSRVRTPSLFRSATSKSIFRASMYS